MKIKIGILGGGPSSEYEVSLATAENVYRSIDREKYDPELLTLTKKKGLVAAGKKLSFPKDLKKYDIIFNALHGTFGEDGAIQKILDKQNIVYTGSRARASKIGMDKLASRRAFVEAGLDVARLTSRPPLVLKPRFGGSSVGVKIVETPKGMPRGKRGLISEEYLPGREFTVGVLEIGGNPVALPVVEIKPKAKYKFFDYEAKYKSGASEEIVPANIPPELAKKIRLAAVTAHRAIGAEIYSRSDFIVNKRKVYILEINTLPGLTKNSLLPKAAKAIGISLPRLLDTIIVSSLRRSR